MKIGLVLGGGGARAFAHAGVVRALDEAGHEVIAIAGCSMGGIIGAFYASGKTPNEIEELGKKLRPADLIRPGKSGGLFGGGGIHKLLESHLPESFEDLKIPLQVTATDIQKGQLIVLNRGGLVPALRATSAIPGLLSPVFYQDKVLGDGGSLNNLPVDIVRTMTHQPVVAVDVAPPPNRHLIFEDKRSLADRVKALFSKEQRWLTIELFMKSFDISQAVITEMRLSLQPPDLLLRPPLPVDLKLEDFERVDEASRIGYDATVRALESTGSEFLSPPSGA